MRLPHRATLGRRTYSGEDPRYRNEELGGLTPIACRARFDPISGDEEVTNRNTGRASYNVVLAPTGADAGRTAADLASYDQITWDAEGLTLELEGPAVALSDGIGRRHHFEAVAFVVKPR